MDDVLAAATTGAVLGLLMWFVRGSGFLPRRDLSLLGVVVGTATGAVVLTVLWLLTAPLWRLPDDVGSTIATIFGCFLGMAAVTVFHPRELP